MRKLMTEHYDRGYNDGRAGKLYEPNTKQDTERRSYTEGFADSRLSDRYRLTKVVPDA